MVSCLWGNPMKKTQIAPPNSPIVTKLNPRGNVHFLPGSLGKSQTQTRKARSSVMAFDPKTSKWFRIPCAAPTLTIAIAAANILFSAMGRGFQSAISLITNVVPMFQAPTQVGALVTASLHHDVLPDHPCSADSTEWCDSAIAVRHFSDFLGVSAHVSAVAPTNLELNATRTTRNLCNFSSI